jgi:hypothetical protein
MDPIEQLVLDFLDAYAAEVTKWTDWPVKRRWWEPKAGPYEGVANLHFTKGEVVVGPVIEHSTAQSLLPVILDDPRFKRIYVMWVKMVGRSLIQFYMTVAPEDPIAVIDTLTPEQLIELRKKV